jgi:Fe-S-cluster-containing dehydrogenase component
MAETEKQNSKKLSRREFLKDAGLVAGGVALGSMGILSACKGVDTTKTVTDTVNNTITATTTATTTVTSTPTVKVVNDLVNAKYMLVHDAATCIGCRRCELVCTEYNYGIAKPSIANIKVARNINFGPNGSASAGVAHSQGKFGDARIVADTCRQCPHPTPCMQACPYGAIELKGEWNTRVINETKCVGCDLCIKACPYGMTSLDTVAKKAHKCNLCDGSPECVRICPTGSIKLVPWVDKTGTSSTTSIPGYVGGDFSTNCSSCHK